jgi:hypothetical protein
VSKSEQGAAVFGHEFNLDQRPARRQIVPSLPSPSERDAAMRCDLRIGSPSKLASGDLDAKNSPGAGSSVCCWPNQRAIKAGSTKNLKTVSGDAAMKISRSILSIPFIGASVSVRFVPPPASTATTHHPRTMQARLAAWQ